MCVREDVRMNVHTYHALSYTWYFVACLELGLVFHYMANLLLNYEVSLDLHDSLPSDYPSNGSWL